MVYDSSRHGALTRKVILVSCVAALCGFINSMSNIYTLLSNDLLHMNQFSSVAIDLLIVLGIPMCGYFGAKKADKNLLCCFCCCNFFEGFISCLLIIAAIVITVLLSKVNNAMYSCEYDTNGMAVDYQKCAEARETINSLCMGWNIAHNVTMQDEVMKDMRHGEVKAYQNMTLTPEEQEACWNRAHSTLAFLVGMVAFFACTRLCMMGFQCVSGYWGNQLRKTVEDEDFTDDEEALYSGYE
eukprot:TRINITY_DN32097_c0_g1_i1.p1 TRINITY_DN32097_c0_g1~~TRINITY_DN32097_c0_g1_i1.p1  ORF type:complete len:241 (-),score=55.78 TRINITY_DN32097_c0_g1_i1:129-851(-)